MDYEMLGMLLALVIMTLLAFYCLLRSIKAKSKSIVYANFALFFGLLMYFQPELILKYNVQTHPLYFRIGGVIRLLLGLSGLGFCVLAFLQRKKEDEGKAGVIRLILGGLICFTHMVHGVGWLMLITIYPVSSTPWTYQSKKYNFSITLPSKEWQANNPSPNQVQFFSKELPINVFIKTKAEVEKNEFESILVYFKKSIEESPDNLSDSIWEQGKTISKNPYSRVEVITKGENNQKIFVLASYIWHEEQKRLLFINFQGLLHRTSQIGGASELQYYKNRSKEIVLSVK